MRAIAGPAVRRWPAFARGLALACHPLPTVAVTVVATLLAAGVGLPVARVLLLDAAVLTGQLSIGWSNDFLDSGRDTATGRSDKPAAVGDIGRGPLAVAAALALAATCASSLALGWAAASALLLLVAAGWAYNLGLKSTLLSGATYAVGFGSLPVAPYLALAGRSWPAWWGPVTGALLGLAAHFANVLPDLRADAATGVRGLPQRLGAGWSVVAMAATLAAASVVLGVGPSRPTPVAIGCVVVGLLGAAAVVKLARHDPDSQAPFRVMLALALFDVVLVIVLGV